MPVKIFLAVNVKSGKGKEVQGNIKKFEEVTLVCSVSAGTYDIVAFVEVPTLEEYKAFSIDKVSSLQDITDYTSFITIDQ
ncbi:MAG: Lrp/AsnC family transcriptional regulator [Candidatus Thorarchaeota archaeon]